MLSLAEALDQAFSQSLGPAVVTKGTNFEFLTIVHVKIVRGGARIEVVYFIIISDDSIKASREEKFKEFAHLYTKNQFCATVTF